MMQSIRVAIAVAAVGICSAQSCADVSFNNVSNNRATGCVVDADCLDAERCVRGQCALECVIDEDCDGGICRSELRNEQDDVVDVCVDDPDPQNSTECRFDSDCAEAFDMPGALCGIDGVCFVPENIHGLLIRDLTDVSSVDLGQPAPDGGHGADIAAVYLTDPASGEPIAWAETLELMPANDIALQNAPDGASVAISSDTMCVAAPYEQAATPLGGAGGYLLVRFLEVGSGRVVNTPPEDWHVTVVEWGAQCPGGDLGEPDTYEVVPCTAAATGTINTAADCRGSLGQGTGYLEMGPS